MENPERKNVVTSDLKRLITAASVRFQRVDQRIVQRVAGSGCGVHMDAALNDFIGAFGVVAVFVRDETRGDIGQVKTGEFAEFCERHAAFQCQTGFAVVN